MSDLSALVATGLGPLIEALRDQRQIDEDGTLCGVSRQAVDEAITLLEGCAAMERERDKARRSAHSAGELMKLAEAERDAALVDARRESVRADALRDALTAFYSDGYIQSIIDSAMSAGSVPPGAVEPPRGPA